VSGTAGTDRPQAAARDAIPSPRTAAASTRQRDTLAVVLADPSLVVEASILDDALMLRLVGEADFSSTRASRTAEIDDLYRALEGKDVLLDLSGLAFIDSGGLGWLLRLRAAAVARGRRMRITGAHGPVARVLTLSGVGPLFDADAP
jgi:anti-anti-sigma factor